MFFDWRYIWVLFGGVTAKVEGFLDDGSLFMIDEVVFRL